MEEIIPHHISPKRPIVPGIQNSRVAVSEFAVARPLPCQPVLCALYIGKTRIHFSEFIEILNTGGTPVSLEGWTISDAVSFEFPVGAVIGSGEHAIVASVPLTLPGVTVWSPFERSLSNRAETIVLSDDLSATIDIVRYADDGPWPDAADGDGPSLELIHPSLDNEFPESWAAGPSGGEEPALIGLVLPKENACRPA